MNSECKKMWKDLGLDVAGHDRLLKVLGDSYRDIYLSQRNRPRSTDYLDFVVSEIHGLRIQELTEAKGRGNSIIGTLCLYVPEELILAVEGICVGLCAGADIGTEEAEKVLPRNTCALIKSFFGFKLSALCPYMEVCDLIIGETTCEGKKKAYEIFNDCHPIFVIKVPQIKTLDAGRLWRCELERLAGKIEQVSGKEITAKNLSAAVKIVNAKRSALQRLNALRRANPPPISARDAESCVGERGSRNLVPENGKTSDEILDRIAERYMKIDCACFTPNEERLEHIVEMSRKYNAAGVIHYALQFYTPYTIEATKVEKALAKENTPLLKLETDYSMEDVPQLETRVQAFLEILKQ